MSTHVNHGKFDYLGGKYYKYVQFSKAVLWMTRQLSVPMAVMDRVKKYNVDHMVFTDLGKQEDWEFKSTDVMKLGEMKKVGQEKQWYFPIDIARKRARVPVPYK